ncbi:MAG: hypothetical protein H8E44_17735 [Planctomycetes bacterium]|nr:hypothetical protein [Planctomycetota bacterium]MBL7039593.1 hypothetical protein [Pirellulaceae bacterium]
MAPAKQLTMGVDSPEPAKEEEVERIAVLHATVEKYLPKFAAGIKKAAAEKQCDDAFMLLHQDAFAAGYDDDEYLLLGMAIKYAGLHGVPLNFIGKNHETF